VLNLVALLAEKDNYIPFLSVGRIELPCQGRVTLESGSGKCFNARESLVALRPRMEEDGCALAAPKNCLGYFRHSGAQFSP
jgi:hypothetical protein